jgi:hypothetical protein
VADDDKQVTNGSLHGEVVSLFRRLLGTQALAVLAFGLLTGGTALWAYKALAQEARQQADAGVQSLRLDVNDMTKRLDRHEKDANQTHLELRQELQNVRERVEETQADIRALYRYQRTGLVQPRLEDAGHDGGVP